MKQRYFVDNTRKIARSKHQHSLRNAISSFGHKRGVNAFGMNNKTEHCILSSHPPETIEGKPRFQFDAPITQREENYSLGVRVYGLSFMLTFVFLSSCCFRFRRVCVCAFVNTKTHFRFTKSQQKLFDKDSKRKKSLWKDNSEQQQHNNSKNTHTTAPILIIKHTLSFINLHAPSGRIINNFTVKSFCKQYVM